MTVFQVVKNNVDIIDAAQRYGMNINRHKKALCPYHDDEHPSLSFKGGRFTCFSCGATGDVIDLVGRLVKSTPMETVRELNSSYRLGIDIDKPIDRIEVLRYQREQEKKKSFEAWEKKIAYAYATYFRMLREWRISYAPKSTDEIPDPLFIESCAKKDYIKYICDSVFINGDLAVKQHFYLEHREEAQRVKERVDRGIERDAGRTTADYHQIGALRTRASPSCEHTRQAA